MLVYFTFSAHSSAPPYIHVEIPSFKTAMMAAAEVKATCVVHTVFDAKVTWLLDNRPHSNNQVNQATNSTHIMSILTVSLRQWKNMKLLKCKAEHRCFPSAEETIVVSSKRKRQKINQECFESERSKKKKTLLCFLSLSSRS